MFMSLGIYRLNGQTHQYGSKLLNIRVVNMLHNVQHIEQASLLLNIN